MKSILLALTLLAAINVSAQETKRVASVNTTFNQQHPDKFVLENDEVKITFESAGTMRIDLKVYNKTDKSIDFLWTDTYFVLNGETKNAHNGGMSSVRMHAFHTETVDVNKPQKIAPNASYIASITSTGKVIFDSYAAKAAFKKDGGALVNRVVPVLLINDLKEEFPVSIELYDKKALKR